MELLLRVIALCITACALGLLLKKDVPALQLMLGIATAAVLLTSAAELGRSIGTVMEEFSSMTGIDHSYLTLIVKCMAVAAAVRLGGDLCRDAGQSALASIIEITGTLSAAVMTAPLMKALLNAVLDVL